MATPYCTFQRTGDVWVLIEPCDDGDTKQCPRIPNSKEKTQGAVIMDATHEGAFLDNFRVALGDNAFAFINGDYLVLSCAVATMERSLTYKRGTVEKKLKLKIGDRVPKIEPT